MNLKEFLCKLFGKVKDNQKPVVIKEIAMGTAALMHRATKKIHDLDKTITDAAAVKLIIDEYSRGN